MESTPMVEPPIPPHAPPPPLRGAPRLALVVDDNELVRACLVRILRSAGVEAVTARDGREALALLESSRLRPDLILTDWEMPELGGAELLAALRRDARLAAVPVVVVSGADAPCPEAAARVAKPFSPEEVLDAVSRAARG